MRGILCNIQNNLYRKITVEKERRRGKKETLEEDPKKISFP